MTVTITQRSGLKHVIHVDDSDWAILKNYHWCVMRTDHRSIWYAVARIDGKVRRMHRIILGIEGKKIEVDHIDGNGLNNYRSNLRVATRSQNSANEGPRPHTRKHKSIYKGITWSKKLNKWMAQIRYQGDHIYLGYFEKEEDAARAYDLACKIYFGSFARPNFNVEESH
jgi:HNH endonuclease